VLVAQRGQRLLDDGGGKGERVVGVGRWVRVVGVTMVVVSVVVGG